MSSLNEITPLLIKDSTQVYHKLQQHWFMTSKFRKWSGLVVLNIVVSIASGPIYGWQTLEKNMIDEGCTHTLGELNTIWSVACGLMLVTSLPAGLLFDRLGPRFLSVGGVLMAAFGLIGMGLSLMYADKLTWLLGPSYVLALVFSSLSSWGQYIYLWILVENPITVNSIIVSSYALPDAIAMASVRLTSCCNIPPGVFYLCIGVLSLVLTVFCYVLLPSREEASLLKKNAVEMMSAIDKVVDAVNFNNEGDVEVQELVDLDCCGHSMSCFKLERTMLYDLYILITRVFPAATGFFLTHLFSLYMVFMTLSLYMYAFYLTMFSESTSITLVNVYLYIYGLLGAVSLVVMGVFFDRLGLLGGLAVCNFLCLLFLTFVQLPHFATQVVALVVDTVLINLYMVFTARFAQIYSPPQIFGAYNGFLLFMLGILQLICSAIGGKLTSNMSNVWRYNAQFIFWGVMTFVTGLWLWWWFAFMQPLPKLGESNMTRIYRVRNK